MNKILLTGATGFIGSNIYSYLKKKNYRLLCPSRKKYKNPDFIHCDLSHNIFKKIDFKFDAILHCASISPIQYKKQTYKDYLQNNVRTTKNLIKFANKKKINKFFYLSSISAYGDVLDQKLDRRSKINNPDHYGRSKLISETLLLNDKNYFKSFIIRLPGVVGKKSKRNWLTKIFKEIKKNKSLDIYNPHEYFNNCIHVSDLFHLLDSFLKPSTFKYNDYITIGSKENMKIIEVVKLMIKLTKSTSKINIKKINKNSFTISNHYAIKNYKYSPSKTSEVINQFVKENI